MLARKDQNWADEERHHEWHETVARFHNLSRERAARRIWTSEHKLGEAAMTNLPELLVMGLRALGQKVSEARQSITGWALFLGQNVSYRSERKIGIRTIA